MNPSETHAKATSTPKTGLAALLRAALSVRAGISGGGEGQFEQASGVAIDNSAGLTHGDIYVADLINHRVDRFGPKGEFILAFGEAGSGPGQFVELGSNGVAVGPTGTVYVADIGRVEKFSPAGVLEGEIALPLGGPSVGTIYDLLVDSAGELYVLLSNESEAGVRKFNGAGEEQGAPRDPGVSNREPSIALGEGNELLVKDPVQGHIYGYDPLGVQTRSVLLPEPSARRMTLTLLSADGHYALLRCPSAPGFSNVNHPSSICSPRHRSCAALAEGLERAKRVGSQGDRSREEPRAPRMRRGLQNIIKTITAPAGLVASRRGSADARVSVGQHKLVRARGNHEVSEVADVSDQGQVSKLMIARLEGHGLVQNTKAFINSRPLGALPHNNRWAFASSPSISLPSAESFLTRGGVELMMARPIVFTRLNRAGNDTCLTSAVFAPGEAARSQRPKKARIFF